VAVSHRLPSWLRRGTLRTAYLARVIHPCQLITNNTTGDAFAAAEFRTNALPVSRHEHTNDINQWTACPQANAPLLAAAVAYRSPLTGPCRRYNPDANRPGPGFRTMCKDSWTVRRSIVRALNKKNHDRRSPPSNTQCSPVKSIRGLVPPALSRPTNGFFTSQ